MLADIALLDDGVKERLDSTFIIDVLHLQISLRGRGEDRHPQMLQLNSSQGAERNIEAENH